jgi:hypothetical protein
MTTTTMSMAPSDHNTSSNEDLREKMKKLIDYQFPIFLILLVNGL